MRIKKKLGLSIGLALLLLLLITGTVLAKGSLPFTASAVDFVQVDPGKIKSSLKDGVLKDGVVKVKTRKEVNSVKLLCDGDEVCEELGLEGATFTETHISKFEVDLATGVLTGDLRGKFKISDLTDDLKDLKGKIKKVDITGLAGPGELFGLPGCPLAVSVTDVGEWKIKKPKAKGTFTLTAVGCSIVLPGDSLATMPRSGQVRISRACCPTSKVGSHEPLLLP